MSVSQSLRSAKPTVTRAARLLGAGALALATLTACGGGDDADTITFAAVPAESSTSLQTSFENITKLIEQETGKTVEFQNASDYASVIEGQRAGQIDIASYGPFSYVIAKDSGIDLEPVVAPTNDENTPPAYTSLAYVKSDSDIENIEDLRGKNVCFVDPSSTSGYLVPMKGLMDAGIDMQADLTEVIAGGHDSSLLSVESGNCDVGFAHDAMLKTLEDTGQIEPGSLKPIWESEPITEDPIALNKTTLDAETVEKITTVLREKANKPALVEAGICSSVEDCELPEEIEWGYRAVDDGDYDSIREICEVTDAEACHNVG